jgi:hypothetical protein
MPSPLTRKSAKPSLSLVANDHAQVFRLRIELDQTEPLVWRRIEVIASSTFWDLHVAIQDAFGWLDYHLYEFEVGRVRIGVPDELAEEAIVPSWTVPLSKYLGKVRTLSYLYDFGDDWHHTVHLEEVKEARDGNYPRCLAGENATPPEDCGGVHGFEELKKALTQPKTAKYRDIRDWLKNRHAKVYWPFDPWAFDQLSVVFRDPAKQINALLR